MLVARFDDGIDLSREGRRRAWLAQQQRDGWLVGGAAAAEKEAAREAARRIRENLARNAAFRLADMKRQADSAIAAARIASERARAELRGRPKISNALPFSAIMARVSRATGVSKAEILSARRHRHTVLARQAVAYWAYRRTVLSLPEIGRKLGGRDHTTILSAVRNYPKKRAANGRKLRRHCRPHSG